MYGCAEAARKCGCHYLPNRNKIFSNETNFRMAMWAAGASLESLSNKSARNIMFSSVDIATVVVDHKLADFNSEHTVHLLNLIFITKYILLCPIHSRHDIMAKRKETQ